MYTIGKHSELKWFKKCKKGIFKNWKQLKKTTFYLVFALVKQKSSLICLNFETWLFSRAFWSESREKREKTWFSRFARKSYFFSRFSLDSDQNAWEKSHVSQLRKIKLLISLTSAEIQGRK